MTFQLIITANARNQLRRTAKWYRDTAQSDDVGTRWLNGFQKTMESLKTDPHRFGLVRESHRFPFELRELLYGSGRRKTHRAVFRIIGDRVEVVAIRHLAQRALKPDDIP